MSSPSNTSDSFPDTRSEKDQRILKDRRQKPTKPISRYIFYGRRQSIRRQEDRATNLYVDRYDRRLLLTLTLILLFSVLDFYFTIFQIEHGAQEINPLMNLLLGHGYMGSFIVKYLVTASAVFFLCIHRNLLFVRIGISIILLFSSAVFIYQLFGIFLV